MVAIFVNYLEKRLVFILVRNTIIAKQLVSLFLIYITRHISILDFIISNQGL
jgi:hypothetical protein